MRSEGEQVAVSQRSGALAARKVHQNCGVEHWLDSDAGPLALPRLLSLVAGMTAGRGDSAQAAVERQDVRREEADVGAS
ncbi:hypothetical protein VZT92_003097 [Zoarces viviparus]|uniref:Uncharacterized protein n=1 Tax=Zoarces viviparus TaxID=48416 RepID=A0AAW1G1G5_ZOAVI